jgi:radical SAM protein with 4Fe4S-binding SPASM domain
MPLVLHPGLMLRRDVDRVILYAREDDGPSKATKNIAPIALDPISAVIMSLFDGQRETQDIAEIWSYLSNLPIEPSKKVVSSVIKRYSDVFIIAPSRDNEFRRYDPREFVIAPDKVDLSMPRCKIPTGMLFIPTLRCPQACVYCYADTREKEQELLPLSRIYDIIQEAKRLRFGGISISGGEPFVHRDIFKILKWILEAGFHPQIPTKYPLAKRQVYQIKDIGFDSFQISLDSVQPNIASFLTGMGADYFVRIMRTIDYAAEAGLKLSIVSVVTAHNLRYIPDMIKQLAARPHIFRIRLTGCGRSNYRQCEALLPSYAEYQRLNDEINILKEQFQSVEMGLSYMKDPSLMSKEEKLEFFRNRSQCSAGRWSFVLLPDGKVTPCEELYYHPAFVVGDLKQQSILEMWNSERFHKLLNPDQDTFGDSPCRHCKEFIECHTGKGRCWKRALQAYGRHYFPDPFCPYSPRGYKIC